jgi:hypothetical protein
MLAKLGNIPAFFLQPVHIFRDNERSDLRPDLVAGLTIAVILLPQAFAHALIAELPPATGLYAAVVAAIVGALWGSCRQLQTGPSNAISRREVAGGHRAPFVTRREMTWTDIHRATWAWT